MTAQTRRIRVALNGYGVIGKRVADAIACQDDMELVGVADIATDGRLRVAAELWRNFGDGVNQAADFFSAATSIPSRNVTPLTTFGN